MHEAHEQSALRAENASSGGGGSNSGYLRRCCSGALESTPRSVLVLFFNTLLAGTSGLMTTVIWLLYLNAQGWTSPSDIRFYALVSATGVFLPVLLNPLVGFLQEKRSTKEILVIESLLSCTGYILMATVYLRWVFFAGFVLSCSQGGMRSLRISYVSSRTTTSARSQLLGALSMGFVLGAVFGPLLALLCALAPPPTDSIKLGALEIDRCTVTLWTAALLMLVKLTSVVLLFHESPPLAPEAYGDSSPSPAKVSGNTTVQTNECHVDGDSKQPKISHRLIGVVLLIYLLQFLVALTNGCYVVAAAPVLVNIFNYTQVDLALITLSIALISIFPVGLFLYLSKFVKDRLLILLAFFFVFVGVVFFSVPPMLEWQVLLGLTFFMPFYSIVYTSMPALLTKMLSGVRAGHLLMGLLMSVAALGVGIGNLIGGLTLIELYGRQLYSIFAVPSLLALLLVLLFFRTLDPTRHEHSTVVSAP